MKVLHESYLRRLTPEQRKNIGQMTAEEALARAEIKNERDLQKIIRSYLEFKGIVVFDQRMDKRTRGQVGQPDFLFSIAKVNKPSCRLEVSACAWEIKMPDGKLSVEQQQMRARLTTPPNGWSFRVIRSLDEAITELKRMGVQ